MILYVSIGFTPSRVLKNFKKYTCLLLEGKGILHLFDSERLIYILFSTLPLVKVLLKDI